MIIKLELTESQARRLAYILQWADDKAQLEILKDKRRANHTEQNVIELAEVLRHEIKKQLGD